MPMTQSPFRAGAPPYVVCGPRHAGFTLVELIFAITIVAIMLAIGVPALRDMMLTQRVRGVANDFYTDLAYARAEAIKRNAQVTLQQETGGWLNGWSVQAGGNAIRNQGAVTDVTLGGDTGTTAIVFNPDGRVTAANTTNFTFSSTSGGAVSMRCVVVTASGRPAVLVDSNRNGNCQDG
jgi:type IV fimbrial biogenesis protein FimT